MITNEVEEELNLLNRHLEVLKIAQNEGPIGMGEISKKSDIPKHKVRYSLRILEKEGLIEPSKKGAIAKNIEPFAKDFSKKLDQESRKIEKMKRILNDLSERDN